MKKLLFLSAVVMLLASCHKEPDQSNLSNDLVVLTNYDSEADFTDYNTYYLPDSILIISENPNATYWTDTQAASILSAIESIMNERGYTRTTDKEAADLGIQTSYVQNTSYFHTYSNPYWWWDYPGYWGSGYWGWGSGGWYYPYPIVYSYNTGSMLAEILDLKAQTNRDTQSKLPVIWTAYMQGLAYSSQEYNATLIIRAVNQAFRQSLYITNLSD